MITPESKTVLITCDSCEKQYPINEMAREEPLPAPYESVTEGFLLCPNCGLRTHTYYLPEFLRQEQGRLSKALDAYKAAKTEEAWHTYEQHLRIYQKNYTAAQEKYRTLMETESGRNQGS